MGELALFEGKLPAYLKKAAKNNAALTAHISSGYPVVSIKGKVFTLVRGEEKKIITKPDDPDEPATSLEVVIVAANPNLSKVYYATGYEEGSAAKPDCYSNDGIAPAADATAPQSKKCAACKHNVWGTGQNGKGKKCSDSRRVAIAPSGQLNDPMLLRVPPASLKPLGEYGAMLDKRGVPFDAVITRVRFDPSESSPKLMFAPRGLLDEDQYTAMQEVANSELVQQIIGLSNGHEAAGELPFDSDEDDAPKPKAKKPEKKVEVSDDEVEDLGLGDDEEEEAPKPKAKPKAKPAPKPKADDEDDLDALLDEFDD